MNLTLASTPKRLIAFVIDEVTVAILLLIIFYDPIMAIVASVPSNMTEEAQIVFRQQIEGFNRQNLLLIIGLKVLYHAFLIWQNQGMTLGKYVMKIRVVHLNTQQRPHLSAALMRASLRVVSEMLFYIGFLLALFLPMKQTAHDKFSACVVVDA